MADAVDHPQHYNELPNGIECIDVVRHFNFNRGNAIKYVWRAGHKGDTVEDLRKAIWYLQDEIKQLQLAEGPVEIDSKTRSYDCGCIEQLYRGAWRPSLLCGRHSAGRPK